MKSEFDYRVYLKNDASKKLVGYNLYKTIGLNLYGEEIEEEHLPCNCFLVNENGELVSDLISFDFNFFSPNDDFKTLKDGSVVWTFVDDDNIFVF